MDDKTDISVDGKKLTLHELLEILEEDDGDAIPSLGLDVTILPPPNCNDNVTDEDSGPEEDPNLNNLPGSQLLAEVVVSDPGNNLYFSSTSEHDDSAKPSGQSNLAQKCHRKRKRTPLPPQNQRMLKKKKVTRSYEWKREELEKTDNVWPTKSTCENEKGKSPLDYFRYFIDDEVLKMILRFTNQYAVKHNLLGNITEDELLTFIGVLLLSGYSPVPRKHMYWQSNKDAHNELIAGAISRDRFQFIMSNLHVCNNDELDKTDRFAKIRPLLDMLNKRFIDFLPHEQNHSVDESMVPYFGSHGAKQFIRGKPIRFGMKFWCGGTSSGYLAWLEPYQGANTCSKNYSDKSMGYGVVMSYIDELPPLIPYRVYFDNLFTSVELLDAMKKRHIGGTGTIRANRIHGSCPLKSVEEMKKKDRGAYDYSTDHLSGVSVTRWNDNNIVTMATNFDGVRPLKSASRFSREKKKKIQVTQPQVIHNYNQFMGGIDRADQNISLYRCGIRGKKWYFPLLAHLIDVCEHNAWQLYRRKESKNMDHLEFRRRVADNILESNTRVVSQRGCPSKTSYVDSRYDGLDHLVCSLPTLPTGKKQQLKCRACSKKTTTKCMKCDIPLHVDCFVSYHKK